MAAQMGRRGGLRGFARMKNILLLLSLAIVWISLLGFASSTLAANSQETTIQYKYLYSVGGFSLYEVENIGELSLEVPPTSVSYITPSSVKLYAYLPDPYLWRRLDGLPVEYSPREARSYGFAGDTLLLWLPSSVEPSRLLKGGNSGSSAPEKEIIVVGSETLRGFAARLARLHEARGIAVEIVSIDYIASHYKPAEKPPYTVGREYVEKFSQLEYNMTKALSLVSFLREVAEKHEAKYVLLLGNSTQIPSFYYRSQVLTSLLSPSQGLVATDYWYMDPDYDMNIELFVGRIPFIDIVGLDAYIDSVEAWLKKGDWQRHGLIAGGALFAWPLMMGETFASDASTSLASKLDLAYLLLTTGNYSSLEFSSSIGGYGYYFIGSHGVGNAYVDYKPGGVWGYQFEELLRADSIPRAWRPGVYASPACLTAWWDYDFINPGFTPPSIGVALLEKGAAVAYVGPTRIAIEFLVDLSAQENGDYSVGYYGAMRLVQLFSAMLETSATLGEAYAKALEAYLSLPYTSLEAITEFGAEKLGYLTLFEFTFLGDPALPNTASELPTKERKPVDMQPRGYTPFPLKALLTSFASEAKGELPLLEEPSRSNVSVFFNRCPSAAKAVAVYRYSGVLVDLKVEDIELEETSEGCRGVFAPPSNPPGMYIIEYWYNTTLERRILLVVGVETEVNGRSVRIMVQGVDLLRVLGDEPLLLLVDNKTVAVLAGGYYSYETTVQLEPGVHVLTLAPWQDYSLIAGGVEVAEAKKKILEAFTREIIVPKETRPRSVPLTISVAKSAKGSYILVMLEGSPVDANITVESLKGGEKLAAKRIARGIYYIPTQSDPLVVEAYYSNESLVAKALAILPPKLSQENKTSSLKTFTTIKTNIGVSEEAMPNTPLPQQEKQARKEDQITAITATATASLALSTIALVLVVLQKRKTA